MTDLILAPARDLRVLFVTEWYPSRDNPMAGVFVREHARAVRSFADVTVLHCAGANPSSSRMWHVTRELDPEITCGIPTYRVWYRDHPFPGVTTFIYTLSVMRAMAGIIASGFDPDLIHAHIYEAGLPAALFAHRRRLPILISEHDSDFPRRRLPVLQLLKARLAFGLADRVLPDSRALQEGIEHHGIRAHFHVIPNVVDTNLFQPPSTPRLRDTRWRLIFVGSLIPVKGLDLLLKALGKLKARRDDWQLEIMGEGGLRQQLEQLSKDLGLEGSATFLGLGSKTDVATLMASADLLIVPSRWENAPCVIIEAMACGVPVLASRIGGIPELVDEEVGQLFDSEDVDALVSGLVTMLSRLPDLDRDAIRARAERFSLDAVGEQLRTVYEEVLAQHGRRSGASDDRTTVPKRSDD